MQHSEKQVNNSKAIDEDFLMAMMAGGEKEKPAANPVGEQKPPQPKVVAKETGRPRKGVGTDYEAMFFKNPDTAARNGKSVYIRPEYHERLTRIVQVIGEDKLTIYAYLDNVLEHHFQEFGDQIIESFNAKYKPIL